MSIRIKFTANICAYIIRINTLIATRVLSVDRLNKLFILLFLLCGCSRQQPPTVDIDPSFQEIVDEFVGESANQNRPVDITNLAIHFSNALDSWVPGECIYYGGDAPNTILINQQNWENETFQYQKIVLFHELGHCVLLREHVYTGSIYNGFCSATSIMWPYVEENLNMYYENWDAYMQELFTGVSDAPPCSFNNYWGGT